MSSPRPRRGSTTSRPLYRSVDVLFSTCLHPSRYLSMHVFLNIMLCVSHVSQAGNATRLTFTCVLACVSLNLIDSHSPPSHLSHKTTSTISAELHLDHRLPLTCACCP